jgi:hypothetical protein
MDQETQDALCRSDPRRIQWIRWRFCQNCLIQCSGDDFFGKSWEIFDWCYGLNILCSIFQKIPYAVKIVLKTPQYLVRQGGFEQDDVVGRVSFLLISIISHGIPVHTMRTGTKRGKKTPKQLPSQVSYRHPASSKQEIRRAGEQTSPQVARAVGHAARRDEGGGLGSGSSSIRRFVSKGSHAASGGIERITGQWFAGSEARATTRWTARGGCLSRPLFAVFWRPATRTGPTG